MTVGFDKKADIRAFRRESFNDTSAPVQAYRLLYFFDDVSQNFVYVPRSPVVLSALTDFWVEARGSGGEVQVSVDFEILLVDN